MESERNGGDEERKVSGVRESHESDLMERVTFHVCICLPLIRETYR